ncbi:MAG TPA: hypothetical protein EYQ54_01955 [Myxococcales bacterium]|nr:hypothetical protein [Myxococcales bacterium]
MSMGPDFSDGNVPQRSFGERLLGAIKLDATVYEEVEHTPDAMGQAAGVVVLAVVARTFGVPGDGGLVIGLLSGFIGWLIGTAVIWLIGVQILKHTSDFQELLRTLGFASAPQVLYVLGILPLGPLAPLLLLAVGVLGLFAWVIAVRQALDVTTGRSIVICLLAQIPGFVILLLAVAATPPA